MGVQYAARLRIAGRRLWCACRADAGSCARAHSGAREHRRAVGSYGKEVTAADIKASWEWSADPAQKVGNLAISIGDVKGYADVSGGKAKEITGLVAKDDATLEMTLSSGDPFFDTKLAP